MVLCHQHNAEMLTHYLISILYQLCWLCRIYDRLICEWHIGNDVVVTPFKVTE
jgi:hypothetical protein